MRQLNKNEVLLQIEMSAKVLLDTVNTGDYKKGNRENKKLIKIFKCFEKDLSFATDCISEMYKSTNIVVISKACAYSLALGIDVDRAIRTLETISNDKKYGIYRLNAEMTLKAWNENKKLSIYLK